MKRTCAKLGLIEAGGKVDQETRTWDDAQGITIGMRKKTTKTITVTSLNQIWYQL